MSYVRDRLIQAIVTICAIVALTFFFNRLMPGGPVQWLRRDIMENPELYGLPQDPPEQMVEQTIEEILNIPPGDSLQDQFVNYMWGVLTRGDFGESIIVAPGADVWDLILIYAPWTAFISVVATVFTLPIGIILGAFMAYYEGSKFDVGVTAWTVLSSSIPYYVVAIFLLYMLAFQLGWFPTGGRADPRADPGMNLQWTLSVFWYASLPALSFILPGIGGALGLRANSIRLLGSEYVRNAHLRGLGTYRISMTYLVRNAILPMWTGIIIGIGGILGGSIIMEMIFQYPGMGLLMFDAAIQRDWPVLMGVFTITATMFVIGTLLADFTYPLIDPRADVKESKE